MALVKRVLLGVHSPEFPEPLWNTFISHSVNNGAVSSDVKRPEYETDRSSLPSAKVMNAWNCISTLNMVLLVVLLSYALAIYSLPVLLLLLLSSSSSSSSYVLLWASIHPVQAVRLHPFIGHSCPHGGPRDTNITTVYVFSTKQRNLMDFCWILSTASPPCHPRPSCAPWHEENCCYSLHFL